MAASEQCARDLVRLISEYSELYWAAGWMDGVEYEVWERIEDLKRGERILLRAWSVTPIMRQIVQVVDSCGIWVRWDRKDPAHVLIDGRPIVIMTVEQWLSHLMEKAL